MSLPIVKAHAYGNDFLLTAEQQAASYDPASLARATCDRHLGIGADGLILYREAPEGASMRLINSDGSRAEVSGNGVRCLAAFLVQRLGADRPRDAPTRNLTIVTDAGAKSLTLLDIRDGRYYFRAAMGTPESFRQMPIEAGGEKVEAVALWMGNPQCVVLGRLPDTSRFERLGPALERHEAFPAGTNVEFAEVVSPREVRILIWERGAGPTLSSGTGSCAAAVVAARYGGAERAVNITSPGGSQHVDWREDGVYLTGWAEILMEGAWLPGPS